MPYVPKGRPAERGCAGGGSSPSPPLWSSVTEEQTLLSGCSRAFSPVPDSGPPDRQPAAQQQVRRGMLLITGRSTGLFWAKSRTMEVHLRRNQRQESDSHDIQSNN